MTHAELVYRAYRWLLVKRCAVVVWKRNINCVEQPDALGFDRNGRSILVECKASRKDYLRDRRKGHRTTSPGVGWVRYYLSPPGVIRPADLPLGWGLLHVVGRSVLTEVEAAPRSERNWWEEVKHLVRQVKSPDGVPPNPRMESPDVRPRRRKADRQVPEPDRPADQPPDHHAAGQ